MATGDTAGWVARAQRGDLAAFNALVRAHQGAAFGYALVQLGESSAAQDAVQDAFVDAYVHIGQLREPRAFRAWLRRAVHKHCDRQRRRRRPETGTPVDEPAPEHERGDVVIEEAQRRRALLRAVEQLPEHERFVVALHYLAGQPVKVVADFLSLTVSAVKKRLFSARRRLQKEITTMTHTPIEPTPFADRIEMFLAVRAGNLNAVRRLITADPSLVEASETWSDNEALAGGFTLAHGHTPLILAATHGDEAMVELLLAAGAQPGGRCGCANGDSALWAASRTGHQAIADRLRAAGANTEVSNAKGYTTEKLLAWRHAKRPSAATIAPSGGITTGIRAVDLWCPLKAGSVILVHGAAETGLTVLLSEIASAIGRAGGTSVWTTWEPRPWQRRELETLAAQYNIGQHVSVVTDAADHTNVLDAALASVSKLSERHPFVAHVIFEQEGHSAELEAAFPKIRDTSASNVVTFVVRPWIPVTRGDRPRPVGDGPFDGRICTDRRLAVQRIYPAIDPVDSRSRWSADPSVDRARTLIQRYAELDPQLSRRPTSGDSPELRDLLTRSRALLDLTVQPFACAEPDTGLIGTSHPLSDTLRHVRAILESPVDDVEARSSLDLGVD